MKPQRVLALVHKGPEPPDAKVDKDGRLVLAGDADLADKLARGLVMIYVGKLQR